MKIGNVVHELGSEIKYNRVGLDKSFYEKKDNYKTVKDKDGFPEYSTIGIKRFGYRDPKICSEYEAKLREGLKPEPYFTKKDGKIYFIIKDFFDSYKKFGPGSREVEYNLLCRLARYFNIMNRQINGNMYKKYDPMIDKINAAKVKAAYKKGTIIGKRNPLKEAVWAVTHSYVIDRIFSENYQFRMIPKQPELVPLWNHYLEKLDDIPEIVKAYYHLDENCESAFTIHFKKTKDDKSYDDNEIIFESDPVVKEHPVDDHEPGAVPESDNVPFEEAVVETANTIIDTVVDAAKELKNAINNDTSDKKEKDDKIIDGKFELINVPEVPEKKDVNKNKPDDKKDTESSEQKIEKTESSKIVINRPEEKDPNIKINNESSEANVRNLYKFTDLCRKLGYSVIYSNNQYYPMLVQAFVFNRSNSDKDRRYIMIDPCVVYGDTLRIIHISDNHSGIRNGCFVAISQKQLVEKIIKGTFTKEDRKANNDQLPKVLSDYKDKYYFIDRIDLRNLQSITYNKETKRSISFRDWKGFIVNVSNIFKNPDIPVCRFRITNFKDIAHFKLICDDKVQIYYRSNLPNEESQIKAMASKFWISYDADNQDFQYIYGVMSE